MKSMRWQMLSVVGSMVLLTGLCSATATEVILGESSPGEVLFTNTGLDSVGISFTGTCGSNLDCLSGPGYYVSSGGISHSGSYDMWITGGTPSLGSPAGGVYPINMNGATINLAFGYGSSFLDGTLTLENVVAGTNDPSFSGALYITSTNIPGFSKGGYEDMDFSVYLGSNPGIDNVYAGNAPSTKGPILSGEFAPAPEPGSILLFGSGVLGLAAALRRKLMM
jgi:PEP-CTERM motif